MGVLKFLREMCLKRISVFVLCFSLPTFEHWSPQGQAMLTDLSFVLTWDLSKKQVEDPKMSRDPTTGNSGSRIANTSGFSSGNPLGTLRRFKSSFLYGQRRTKNEIRRCKDGLQKQCVRWPFSKATNCNQRICKFHFGLPLYPCLSIWIYSYSYEIAWLIVRLRVDL